jgi:3-hydroxyacyl-CoA dehydrogenase
VVDDLTGEKMGRAKSGTFRTADVVGLDTIGHVMKTLQDTLQGDPFEPSTRRRRRSPADRRGRARPEGQGAASTARSARTSSASTRPRRLRAGRRQGRRDGRRILKKKDRPSA